MFVESNDFNAFWETFHCMPSCPNLYNPFAVLSFTCTKNLSRAFVKPNCFGLA